MSAIFGVQVCVKKIVSAFLLCLLLISGKIAAAAPEVDGLAGAKQLYYEGVAGNKSALKQSAARFTELAKQSPTNRTVQAYRGSLLLLEASQTWAMWKKYELSKQGLVLLDTAVEQAPDNLEVLFVRAATTRNLPGMFNRSAQSKDDLKYLAPKVEHAVHDGVLEAHIGAAALLFYAEDVATGDEKRSVLAAAATLSPQSHAGKTAAQALKGLDERPGS